MKKIVWMALVLAGCGTTQRVEVRQPPAASQLECVDTVRTKRFVKEVCTQPPAPPPTVEVQQSPAYPQFEFLQFRGP